MAVGNEVHCRGFQSPRPFLGLRSPLGRFHQRLLMQEGVGAHVVVGEMAVNRVIGGRAEVGRVLLCQIGHPAFCNRIELPRIGGLVITGLVVDVGADILLLFAHALQDPIHLLGIRVVKSIEALDWIEVLFFRILLVFLEDAVKVAHHRGDLPRGYRESVGQLDRLGHRRLGRLEVVTVCVDPVLVTLFLLEDRRRVVHGISVLTGFPAVDGGLAAVCRTQLGRCPFGPRFGEAAKAPTCLVRRRLAWVAGLIQDVLAGAAKCQRVGHLVRDDLHRLTIARILGDLIAERDLVADGVRLGGDAAILRPFALLDRQIFDHVAKAGREHRVDHWVERPLTLTRARLHTGPMLHISIKRGVACRRAAPRTRVAGLILAVNERTHGDSLVFWGSIGS